ncbi:amidase signature domain-containing protein [Nemania diffusa]|nr:amidase signature domain-containing protein [Nemania diffusa]
MKLELQKIVETDNGHLFSVSNTDYIAPKASTIVTVPNLRNAGLITVFLLPQDQPPQVSGEWIRSSVKNYIDNDDVFNAAFLNTVVFHGATEEDADFSTDAREYLAQLGCKRVVFLSEPLLLPDDSSGTCMVTLKPQSTLCSQFELFSIKSPGSQFQSFAIRSRIKTSKAVCSPFAGLRVVIKDNIDLEGVKTSAGNKAFHDTYGPRTKSASCARSIVDLGMVIVGKTKMNSFGNWEEPLEYVDYQAPWNPRADGYQSPGGSSSGSAAAIASYDWLDIAIGTDTWGSVTRPSLWCGCFGFRPSWGSLSADGIEPFCQGWDTAGILTRDLQKCRDFSSVWLSPDKLKKDPMPFTSIIWPTDYWSLIDSDQVEIVRKFVEKVKVGLAIECDEVSFQATWEQSPPSDAQGLSLGDYINKAANAQCYDAYHNCDDFRTSHWELFGRPPYVSPPNQRMWTYAQSISREKRDRDFAKIEKKSNALVIMPLESMTPRYRDEAPTFRRPPQDGINALALAPVLGAPVLSVPIAEIPYQSRITHREEMLPLVLAIMSPPGTDLALMDEVLKVMKRSDMPTIVKTGRSMFK